MHSGHWTLTAQVWALCAASEALVRAAGLPLGCRSSFCSDITLGGQGRGWGRPVSDVLSPSYQRKPPLPTHYRPQTGTCGNCPDLTSQTVTSLCSPRTVPMMHKVPNTNTDNGTQCHALAATSLTVAITLSSCCGTRGQPHAGTYRSLH